MKLTPLERRIVTTVGIPAKDVARAEHRTIAEICELRHTLRALGVLPRMPGVDYSAVPAPADNQLGLFAELMRTNVPLV